MKKLKVTYITLILLSLTISCSNEKEESIIDLDQDKETIKTGLAVKDVIPLPNTLYNHTLRISSNLIFDDLSPNVDNSFIVRYQDSEIETIFTPLNQNLKSTEEIYHVYFKLKDMVSKFHLLISQEILNDAVKRFKYKTTDGKILVIFDVDSTDGRILNIELPNLKSWSDRFENCVEWTFDQMGTWDYLACMAIGPVCAGTIASMCAVGATEGMFESPDGP